MGNEAETIFSSFTFADEANKKKHDTVLDKYDAHFVPKVNRIHERAKFHSRNQQAGENGEAP